MSAEMQPQDRAVAIPFGRWILMEIPWEDNGRFLGFVYLDPSAGPSAKGGPESAAQLAEAPTNTVRLPMPYPIQILSPDQVAQRGLPVPPPWLRYFGPQPDANAAWRNEPDLAGRFHDSCPDDLQVVVHDGEPRRTGRPPELCWVRIFAVERGPLRGFLFDPEATTLTESEFATRYPSSDAVYVARLLNAPYALETAREGDAIRFLAGGGLEYPVQVTAQYLEERSRWRIVPCDMCGAGECLDPPSVLLRARSSDQPPVRELRSFTAVCAMCGGLQTLSRRDGD
jgi:hypothetical protein